MPSASTPSSSRPSTDRMSSTITPWPGRYRSTAIPATTCGSSRSRCSGGAARPSPPPSAGKWNRLSLQLIDFREVVEAILSIANELKGATIEAVMAKSDFDLGLEAVFGGRILSGQRGPEPPPRGPRAGPADADTVRPRGPVLPDGGSPSRTTPSTETWGSASLARAGREFRTLAREFGDAPALRHLGLDLDGVTEAAQARSERLFWVVSNPNQYPGPSTTQRLRGRGSTVPTVPASSARGKFPRLPGWWVPPI